MVADTRLDLRPDTAELARLRFRTLPRRIEHHRVEILKFGCHERAPEQIARLRIDGLEATRFAGRLLKRLDRGGLAVRGRNPRAFRSISSSRQLWALSRTPTWKPSSSFLPSGVAPIITSMHSAVGSMRAWR